MIVDGSIFDILDIFNIHLWLVSKEYHIGISLQVMLIF